MAEFTYQKFGTDSITYSVEQFAPKVSCFDQDIAMSPNASSSRLPRPRPVLFPTYEEAQHAGLVQAAHMIALGARRVEVTVEKRILVAATVDELRPFEPL